MNEFLQVINHLASIREEACYKFDQFLTIKVADESAPSKFSKPYIEGVYKIVYNRVRDQYEADCQVFSTCCRQTITTDNNNYYDKIKSMDLKKIENFKLYKLTLVLNKYEKETGTKEDDKIDKYTLQKWLLEKAI